MALSKPNLVFLLESSYLKYELFLKKRLCWIHEINKERSKYGEFHHLYEKLRQFPEKFFEYTRMKVETFDYILSKIGIHITKSDTSFRKCILPEEKLFVTIRFLSTGLSFRALAQSFRLGRLTVSTIVYETCKAIWVQLSPIHMPKPTEEILRSSMNDYYTMWQFPNCVGAIDGKHCRIRQPPQTGSAFHNYKHYFSIVLQAVADANRRFLTIEVGGRGSQSDGGTFHFSKLNKLLSEGRFNMPQNQRLPSSNTICPTFLIGDEAYPLKLYLMRPYPQSVLDDQKYHFNKCLSRARKTIECAFGITYKKWQILNKPIETKKGNAEIIIKTCCLLHNIIIDKEKPSDWDYAINLSSSRRLRRSGRINNRSTNNAVVLRNKINQYLWDKQLLGH